MACSYDNFSRRYAQNSWFPSLFSSSILKKSLQNEKNSLNDIISASKDAHKILCLKPDNFVAAFLTSLYLLLLFKIKNNNVMPFAKF